MPARELSHGRQIEAWLEDWGSRVSQPCALTLIGSGGLLWHAARREIESSPPENSMAVDPVTEEEAVAELAYEAMIGSDFELRHGWHVNLMPLAALDLLPAGWEARASKHRYGQLSVSVPAPADLLAPKLKRNEPRDRRHYQWAVQNGLVSSE
ncbi:MAG: hypothetical protein N2322_06845 [Terrimicrobiaceae bacterium]|nr:hypothetical protein [Terrimicrobiaceae bacterium]